MDQSCQPCLIKRFADKIFCFCAAAVQRDARDLLLFDRDAADGAFPVHLRRDLGLSCAVRSNKTAFVDLGDRRITAAPHSAVKQVFLRNGGQEKLRIAANEERQRLLTHGDRFQHNRLLRDRSRLWRNCGVHRLRLEGLPVEKDSQDAARRDHKRSRAADSGNQPALFLFFRPAQLSVRLILPDGFGTGIEGLRRLLCLTRAGVFPDRRAAPLLRLPRLPSAAAESRRDHAGPPMLQSSVRDELQREPQLHRAAEALIRVECAGPQDDPLQLRTSVQRRGERLAAHAALQRDTVALGCRNVQRRKRHTPLIQQPVQHKAERILVDLRVVASVLIDLRRHIGIRARLCRPRRMVGHAGDTEIAELKIAVPIDKNILRLDIPVDDFLSLTKLQRPAQIDADFDHRRLIDGGSREICAVVIRQRSQQLHADQDIPARIMVVLHDLVILIADDMAVALHVGKQKEFSRNIVHLRFEICGNALVVQSVIAEGFDIRFVFRHGDHLQRGVLLHAEFVDTDNFINR